MVKILDPGAGIQAVIVEHGLNDQRGLDRCGARKRGDLLILMAPP
jgi:hypothetical protein